MSAKQLLFGDSARQKMLVGINKLADAVVTILVLRVAMLPLIVLGVLPALFTMVFP
jgi:hypothetical protein